MKIEIYDNEKEIEVERPITKLKKELQEFVVDFSSISKLKGDKIILRQCFQDLIKENRN